MMAAPSPAAGADASDRRPCVALTPDVSFQLPLTVAVASLCHQHGHVGCRIFVLHDSLPADAIQSVQEVVHSPSTIEWRVVDETLLEDIAPAPQLPRSSLYTLVVADLLPSDVDRAIYLDVDTVAARPLFELWNLGLEGRPVGAVRGAFMPWMAAVDRFPWRALGMSPREPYFNNGVMLMDVDTWRRDGIRSRAIATMRSHRLPYGEQDALNVLFVGNWKQLHPRWNLQAGHFADPCLAWVTEGIGDLDEAFARPAIVHFNGPNKPWRYGCGHPLAPLWFEALDRTHHQGWRPTPPA